MERVIKLVDGEHTISTPSFYALQLMSDFGVDFDGTFNLRDISNILAAMLTDAEPLNSKGYPAKEWTPPMAAKLLPTGAIEEVMETVSELLNDAFPDAPKDAGSAERPTKARTSSGKA